MQREVLLAFLRYFYHLFWRWASSSLRKSPEQQLSRSPAHLVAPVDLIADGLPAIRSQITIEGNGSIIERSSAEGTPNFRILFVHTNGDLTLNDLTIRNGYNDVFFWSDTGGGGAGIYIHGTMEATNITVIDNYSEIGGGGGGGISVENQTGLDGKGLFTLTNSTVRGNSARQGGGIRVYRKSTAIVINSTISGNTVLGDTAGGIHIGFSSDLTLINSTVSNNYNGVGSGIWNSGSSTTRLINSTISHNYASRPDRGGLANYGELTLKNTIVADQLIGFDCVGGPVTSLGYNLDSDDRCNFNAPGDITTSDPRLGPLQDNGGPSWTHALLEASPAIDAVPVWKCPPNTDQRGVTRPQGLACDIGAFELERTAVIVDIDIKPGSDPNCFNNDGIGVIPVAIFGNVDFDVYTIDPDTVTLDGLAVAAKGKSNKLLVAYEDVNDDGYTDLVIKFEEIDGAFNQGSHNAVLTGTLYDGTYIFGVGDICITQ
jgi:parallel beta-helix repeat protein